MCTFKHWYWIYETLLASSNNNWRRGSTDHGDRTDRPHWSVRPRFRRLATIRREDGDVRSKRSYRRKQGREEACDSIDGSGKAHLQHFTKPPLSCQALREDVWGTNNGAIQSTALRSHAKTLIQQLTRKPWESVSAFVAELRKLSEHWDALDKTLRDRIVGGINDEVIQKKLLSELTYKRAIDIAQGVETSECQLTWDEVPQKPVTVKTEPVHQVERGSSARPPRKQGTPCPRCGMQPACAGLRTSIAKRRDTSPECAGDCNKQLRCTT